MNPNACLKGVVLCSLLLLAVGGVAQGASSLQPAKEVRIEVQIRDLLGDPVASLSRGDFRVQAPGAGPIMFHKADEVGTRLLILQRSADVDVDRLATNELDSIWKKHWRVSVLDLQGRQTPYVQSGAELQLALSRLGKGHTTVENAADELGKFSGRRIIFAVNSRGTELEPTVLRAALEAHAVVYHVGSESAFLPDNSGSSGYSSSVSLGPTGGGIPPRWRSRGRVSEELSILGAERHALADAAGFYDLEVKLASTVASLDLGVALDRATCRRCTVDAEPYAADGTPLPLQVRFKEWYH
jgi:hypothetical protein